MATFVPATQGMPPLHCKIRRRSKLREIVGVLSSANAASPAERQSSPGATPLHNSQGGGIRVGFYQWPTCFVTWPPRGEGGVQARFPPMAMFVPTTQGLPPLHYKIRRRSKLREITGALSSTNAATPAERQSSIATASSHANQGGINATRLRSFIAYQIDSAYQATAVTSCSCRREAPRCTP